MADVKARVQAAIAAREAAVKGAAASVPSPTAPMDASRHRVGQGCAAGCGRREQQCGQPPMGSEFASMALRRLSPDIICGARSGAKRDMLCLMPHRVLLSQSNIQISQQQVPFIIVKITCSKYMQ